ncbi:MAG: DUF1080 domain-containing protein [Acidobacteriota bacterium]
MRILKFLMGCFFCLVWLPGCTAPNSAEAFVEVKVEEVPGWMNLFDGNTLEGWEETNFGGQGKISVSDGAIILNWGAVLTGITWKREFPVADYEIYLEAMKIQGNDFFCALTFPIEDTHASLILGGWGGTVTGITSIMGQDASENETTTIRKYEKNQWYKVRLRVTGERVTAWVDEAVIVDMDTVGADFDIRPEVSLSRPLGIAAFQTTAALRNIRYRKLDENRTGN